MNSTPLKVRIRLSDSSNFWRVETLNGQRTLCTSEKLADARAFCWVNGYDIEGRTQPRSEPKDP
jgi:hypothetical protein